MRFLRHARERCITIITSKFPVPPSTFISYYAGLLPCVVYAQNKHRYAHLREQGVPDPTHGGHPAWRLHDVRMLAMLPLGLVIALRSSPIASLCLFVFIAERPTG
jgi:hypothetical protein